MNPMRYQAKFSNGAWKLFDSHAYDDVAVFDTQREALKAAERANLNLRPQTRRAVEVKPVRG